MRAALITELTGPESVGVGEIPEPRAEGGQSTSGAQEPENGGKVLIEVHAAGVTFPDVLLSRGEYQLRPDLPFVPGSEVAGVVRSAPLEAAVRPGDRVAAFLGVGGFAEIVAADPAAVFPLPDSLSFVAGAAVPMNYFTVHFALTRRGRLQPGETVLVHGAAGGVGTAAVQVAAEFGARVVAVASSPEKAAVARTAGAHEVVPADGFLAGVKEVTGGRGVDVVVDPVGGDRFTDSLRCLAPEGRLLVIGFTGRSIPTVRVNRLLLNNIDVVGVGWGHFFLADMGYLQEQWANLRPMFESGALAPPIGRVYPLDDVASALADLDQRRAAGRVILALR